jgi:hypothetical protein
VPEFNHELCDAAEAASPAKELRGFIHERMVERTGASSVGPLSLSRFPEFASQKPP